MADETLARKRDNAFAEVKNKWNSVPLQDHDMVFTSKDVINDLTAVMPYMFTDSLTVKEALLSNIDWNTLEANTVYPFSKLDGVNIPPFTNLVLTKATGYVFTLSTPTETTYLQICFASDNDNSNVAIRSSLTGSLSGSKWFCLPTIQDLAAVKQYVDTSFTKTVQDVVNQVVGKLNDLINADPQNILNQMAKAQAQVDQAVQQMADVDANIRQVKQVADSTKTELAEMQKDSQANKEGLAALAQTIADLNGSTTTSQQVIKTVAQDVANLENKYESLKGTSSDINKVITDAKTTADNITQNYNQFQHDLTGAKEDIAQVKTTASAVETQLKQLQEEANTVQSNISGARLDVQTALDTVKILTKKIDNFTVGARNYLLDTYKDDTVTGTNSVNQIFALHQFSFGNIKGAVLAGKEVSLSFSYTYSGTGELGTFKPQFNDTPFNIVSDDSSTGKVQESGYYKFTFTFPTVAVDAQVAANGLCIRLDNLATTRSLTIKGMKLEIGNVETDWLPAPEDLASANDIKTVLDSAKKALDTANSALTSANQASTDISQLKSDVADLKTNGTNTAAVTQLQSDVEALQKTTRNLLTLLKQKADSSALDSKVDVSDYNLFKNNVTNQINTAMSTKAESSAVDAVNTKVSVLNSQVIDLFRQVTVLSNKLAELSNTTSA